ncbi:MAG: glutamate synthase, partial [Pseudomonas sp.]|nr:glutamate synthase [Pseudomonas sp.]
MRMTAAVLSLLLSAGAQAEDVQALTAEGLALIPPFQQQLLETVKAAMQAGGPLKAVEACQLQAPLIAVEHSRAPWRV